VLGSPREPPKGYEMLQSGKWREGLSGDLLNMAAERLKRQVLHRQSIVSLKGYIGLGPVPAKTGHMTCVLYGCSVPVHIRKVGDHRVIVGECYIHGLTEARAINLLQKGEVKEDEFALY